jgi:hypothetical protein
VTRVVYVIQHLLSLIISIVFEKFFLRAPSGTGRENCHFNDKYQFQFILCSDPVVKIVEEGRLRWAGHLPTVDHGEPGEASTLW